MLINLQKKKPWRSEEYRKYIRSLACVASGAPAEVAHHITGLKNSGMGTKPSDKYCIPLSVYQHQLLHYCPEAWQKLYGRESDHLKRTVRQARKDGFLDGFERFEDTV